MADPKLPRRTKTPCEWAMLKARARTACDKLQEQMASVTAELDKLQEQMASVTAELDRTADSTEELWNVLWDYPDLIEEAAVLEIDAASVHDHLVLDLQVLDGDILYLEAELFLHYNRELAAVGGGNVTEPTVDATRAAIRVDERHQVIMQRREALVNEVQEAQSVLEQLTVARTAIQQHGESVLRFLANRRAEINIRSVVSQNRPPADPDSPAAEHAEDKSTQADNVDETHPSDRVTPRSRRNRRSQETRRYLGADSLPQFRTYLRWLREFVLMEARFYELARLDPRDNEIAELRQSLVRDTATMFETLPPGTLFGDLLLIAASPIAYADSDVRVRKFTERFLPENRFDKGPLAERVAEFRRELARSRVPRLVGWPADDARLAAAERIVDGIGHAIYPMRWRWVKPALDDLAKDHERSADAELRDTLLGALFEAVEAAGEYTLSEEADARRALRAKLNDLATVDLLGPGWWHATKGVDTPLDETLETERPSAAAEAEARLRLERLVAAAGLSPREREVFEIVAALGGEHGAIATAAERLGIAESTARVLYFRTRKKLLAAARR